MFHTRLFRRLIVFAVSILPLALAACSGSATPQLIGSYPKGASQTYVPPPANLVVVYNAYLELAVSNVDSAADQAIQAAYDRGGYLVSSQTWYQDDRKYTTLTLAIPVAQFESTKKALLRLGALITENTSGELVNAGPGATDWNTFSNVTVQLRSTPAAVELPSLPSLGWNPMRTFEQAFGIFASIFTFLVDIVIWLAVIVGPFVLMGFGARSLLRRLRRP
jgi:uncharacterized protein DUF4349